MVFRLAHSKAFQNRENGNKIDFYFTASFIQFSGSILPIVNVVRQRKGFTKKIYFLLEVPFSNVLEKFTNFALFVV